MSQIKSENPLLPLIQKEYYKRILEESLPRIVQCMHMVPEPMLHWRPNDNCNSIGNLVLHLEGNMRQYIISTLGGSQSHRQRELEFSTQGPFVLKELVQLIQQCAEDSYTVVLGQNESSLVKHYHVQCFELSGYEIISHVIEHFSYHTGQIAILTKILTDEDLGFYKELELN